LIVARVSLSAGARIASDTVARIWSHPENRSRRFSALGSYLVWQVWERTVATPWTVTVVPGRKIRCYPHAPISSGVIYYRLADASEMRFVLDDLRAGDVLFDVGANLGLYSVLATSIDGVSAVAFEPNETSKARARENFALNGVAGRVTLVEAAVGATSGTATFTRDLDAMNRIITDDDQNPTGARASATETVPLVSLDDWCEANGTPSPAVMKIDVEGHELAVLAGAAKLIDRCHPTLILEVNDAPGLQAALDALGYQCVTYDPAARRLTPTTALEHAKYNVIAVHDLEVARQRLAGR
jgi:FkbM family methyltransferase